MNYEIVFESEHIYFIKVNESLINDYLNMINDIEVQKLISDNRKQYTYKDEEEWVKNKLQNNNIVFSMIEKETNEFIGNIELMDVNNNSGELGISITPLKQNKHYGTEAIKSLINYAFNELDLNKIELEVFKTNLRAIHCYENVGFVINENGKTEKDYYMELRK